MHRKRVDISISPPLLLLPRYRDYLDQNNRHGRIIFRMDVRGENANSRLKPSVFRRHLSRAPGECLALGGGAMAVIAGWAAWQLD